MKLAPIVLFVYNRPWHTRQTLIALKQNELANQSDLIIYSDGPRDEKAQAGVQKVRQYIKTVSGFKNTKIIERTRNLGLANSIITGVTEVVDDYGRIIVLEDDLISSTTFLNYMNYYLKLYKNEQKVFSITGFNYPKNILKIPNDYPYSIYFSYRCMSWSLATWIDRWAKADWTVKDYIKFREDRKAQSLFNRGGSDLSNMLNSQMEGKIDSWAIRWCFAHYKNNSYCVYPVKSLIKNIGFDGTGVHCTSTNRCKNYSIHEYFEFQNPASIKVDNWFANRIKKLPNYGWKIMIKRLLLRIIKCIKI